MRDDGRPPGRGPMLLVGAVTVLLSAMVMGALLEFALYLWLTP